jgi:ribulose-phosphate 3-epimerase
MAGRPGGGGRDIGSALIVPSILSADFNRLGDQVREAVAAGADRIQVDVMDGHFVPNLSMGPQFVTAVKRAADVVVEAHLMVERPELFVATFVKAGADVVIVQVESTYSLYRVLHSITEAGARAAVALNPATPVDSLREIVPYVSEINVMTVEPGFGGQKFIATSPSKIKRVRELAPEVEIEVDGGIDPETAPLCVAAGASLLVAGSSVFGHPDGPGAGIAALRASLG